MSLVSPVEMELGQTELLSLGQWSSGNVGHHLVLIGTVNTELDYG